jgi:glycosyltransferase involved in cell wall biosynthesis
MPFDFLSGSSYAKAMRISVIVPAFNEAKLLPATLQSIRTAGTAFTSLGWEMELIVCDNNSTDDTAELAHAAGAWVVFEPVNQIARARNAGAAAATGDWLVFVDADSHPSRELLEDVAQAIRSERCLAGGSTVVMEGESDFGRRGTRLWNWISRTFRYAAGSFLFCEAGAFRALEGFDQRLYASEEIDLSRRLTRLARSRGREMVILDRHPLLTSGRKLHLYPLRDHLRFLAITLLTGKRNLRRRDACPTWYDGRR